VDSATEDDEANPVSGEVIRSDFPFACSVCNLEGRTLYKVVGLSGEPLLHPDEKTARYLAGNTLTFTGNPDSMSVKHKGFHGHTNALAAKKWAQDLYNRGKISVDPRTSHLLSVLKVCERGVIAPDSTGEFQSVGCVHVTETTEIKD